MPAGTPTSSSVARRVCTLGAVARDGEDRRWGIVLIGCFITGFVVYRVTSNLSLWPSLGVAAGVGAAVGLAALLVIWAQKRVTCALQRRRTARLLAHPTVAARLANLRSQSTGTPTDSMV
jgi:hypothetical protein